MLEIISSSSFKTIPWKNGLGKTVEMAISDGGTVDNFDWRISQATVANDGEFSDFSGLERNLVLIKGEGISLLHKMADAALNQGYCQEDHLTQLLDYANFDGGYKTFGKLHGNEPATREIIDLNIMTRADKFDTQVITAKSCNKLALPKADIVFVYSLSSGLILQDEQGEQSIEDGALIKVTDLAGSNYLISGELIILAVINGKN
ncbi:HutD family protein [Thalassotalea euphylliae]|uniref:HutD/Ves family protein n=1 Tax=Thalassotalea euphylliae TaxID=1655234 RepID=UPI00363305CC